MNYRKVDILSWERQSGRIPCIEATGVHDALHTLAVLPALDLLSLVYHDGISGQADFFSRRTTQLVAL